MTEIKASDYDYSLPQELIAQEPMEPRDHSRLMVVRRASGRLAHRRFYHLPEYLRPGDLLVFNDSRVVPARVHGRRRDTGGKVELLLLERLGPGLWRALVRPGRRLRPGVSFEAPDLGGPLRGTVVEREPDGVRVVRLEGDQRLEEVGKIPLPPYIHRPLRDPERYQTVYARAKGSVAAPTAGLHFTEGLLERLEEAGVRTAFVTLHVGLDTFRPLKEEDPRRHKIHTEYWELGPEAARAVNDARREGRRVVAVGTTTVRLLEQAALVASEGGLLRPASGWADLYILPGHTFRVVDAMITNFHLPRSTLLLLVSAFAGREVILRAYDEAVARRYRFYSFGDAMLIL